MKILYLKYHRIYNYFKKDIETLLTLFKNDQRIYEYIYILNA